MGWTRSPSADQCPVTSTVCALRRPGTSNHGTKPAGALGAAPAGQPTTGAGYWAGPDGKPMPIVLQKKIIVGGDELVDALVATGLADSRKSARRTITEGGVSVNNAKVTDPEATLSAEDFLHGAGAVLKRGRKNLAAARLESAASS